MSIELPYGDTTLKADLSWGKNLGCLDIADTPPLATPVRDLRAALKRPIGLPANPCDTIQAQDSVLIIVSDSFRYTAIEQLLPELIAQLEGRGLPDSAIAFLFACGSHRAPTPEEQRKILGDMIYQRFEATLYCHDAQDQSALLHLGQTARQTPVWINRKVIEADHLIVTGSVVLHYFGGFGGGRKAIVPGVAGIQSIAHNHALNLDPKENRLNPAVRIGRLTGNPVAEDMLEAARFVPVTLLINTVLNRDGKIAGLFCGDLEAAHEAATQFAKRQFTVPIQEKADLVIASAGAAKNFIQSHKALFNAYQALKETGRILFLAKAPEGLGSENFCRWIALGSEDAIITELRKNAEINGQTALSTLEKARRATLITDLCEQEVHALGAKKSPTLDQALNEIRDAFRQEGIEHPSYYLMPSAAYAVPIP